VTVGAWLDAGCPGSVDRYVDPVDHAFAGLEARLPDGRVLSVRPAPRRAVGPDLTALVAGCRGRFMTPLTAHLRVHLRDAIKPSTCIVRVDRDPAPTAAESKVLYEIEAAMRAMPLPK
jgi:alkyldihydroxyacetonephosphate synthase